MFVLVPLAVPRGFGLDLRKPVTSSTADFSWEAISEDSVLLSGLFTGYKVSQLVHRSSPLHSFITDLKLSFFANLSHRSLRFLLRD